MRKSIDVSNTGFGLVNNINNIKDNNKCKAKKWNNKANIT